MEKARGLLGGPDMNFSMMETRRGRSSSEASPIPPVLLGTNQSLKEAGSVALHSEFLSAFCLWTGETLIGSCPQLSETIPPIFPLVKEATGQRYNVALPRHTASLVWQTWASVQEVG